MKSWHDEVRCYAKKSLQKFANQMLRDVAISDELKTDATPWVGLRKMKKTGHKTEQETAELKTK